MPKLSAKESKEILKAITNDNLHVLYDFMNKHYDNNFQFEDPVSKLQVRYSERNYQEFIDNTWITKERPTITEISTSKRQKNTPKSTSENVSYESTSVERRNRERFLDLEAEIDRDDNEIEDEDDDEDDDEGKIVRNSNRTNVLQIFFN